MVKARKCGGFIEGDQGWGHQRHQMAALDHARPGPPPRWQEALYILCIFNPWICSYANKKILVLDHPLCHILSWPIVELSERDSWWNIVYCLERDTALVSPETNNHWWLWIINLKSLENLEKSETVELKSSGLRRPSLVSPETSNDGAAPPPISLNTYPPLPMVKSTL